jgi:hypothetical protein
MASPPLTTDSVQKILKDKRETYQSGIGEIVDIFDLGKLFIIELGVVEFSLLVIYFIISLAAISLGIVALSNWVSGKDYKDYTPDGTRFDIASYIVSGIAILLGTIFFGMFLYYYATRKSRVDADLLTAKSDSIRAAVLTKRYGDQIDKSLPAHSRAIMNAVTSETQQAADKVLATEYGTVRSGDDIQTRTDEGISNALADAEARGREAGKQEAAADNALYGKTTYSQKYSSQGYDDVNSKERYWKSQGFNEEDAKKLAIKYSPISLSRSSRRRKSPSSLKKKKKASPTKKKSTSSRRK